MCISTKMSANKHTSKSSSTQRWIMKYERQLDAKRLNPVTH